jgi:DNA mismatch endonuclease (patch repair protein)
MADTLTPEQRQKCMSRVKGKNTKPELALRSALHALGFRFRLHRRNLPGCPDIVLPKYRTVIFLHGCFWHQHPGCRKATIPISNYEFWLAKLRGNAGRDKQNTAILQRNGWRVLTVWECDLKCGEELIAKQLSRIIDTCRETGLDP